jgi:glutamyl-Q tRNA(Asp) synthetase
MHTAAQPSRYRGRFAPSPTGPLHFGSLVTALASWCDARASGGEWLVRMEDLDRPREVPGAADAILAGLAAFGLVADAAVMYQSRRDDRYAVALARLAAAGHVYGCACTRREIADSAVHGIDGPVYPGTCRGGVPPGRTPRATRVHTSGARIAFEDRLQGRIEQDLERAVGDYVLHRADGLYAYQLAVVVDDAEQAITDVVRGADLLDSTPRQIHLQHLLGLQTPRYMHIPVATNAAGEKLSKQTLATAIDRYPPARALFAALVFLGQGPPTGLAEGEVQAVLAWAVRHWDRARLPRVRAVTAPTQFF